jgi:hypothetical protein
MATEKFDFSLRLRHDNNDLSIVTKQLGLSADSGWDKGDPNQTLQGSLRPGTRDISYRSFSLGVATSTDMDDALSECLQRLAPVASVIQSFVSSGGTASLAVGWFCDSAVGGDRIPAEIIAEMAQLNLTLDLYLYLTPESSTATELADTSERE